MRVTLVTKRFDLIGGSERYAGAAARGLAERGHAVRVLCAEGEQEAGVERVAVAGLGDERPSRATRNAVRDAVRSHDSDVVLLLSSLAPGTLESLDAAAPVVRYVQDHTLFCPGMNKVFEDGANCREPLGMRCLERYYLGAGCSGFKRDGATSLRRPIATLAARLADVERHKSLAGLIAASHYMRDQLILAGCEESRVHRVPYFTRSGTDEVPPTPLDPALEDRLATDDPIVLCPARLTLPDKGVDYLLTALGALTVPFRCVIAGAGPAREWLESKARDEGLADRVHFAGWQSPGAIETLYARCDLVAFPSVWDEPFGLVGLEAAAHEKAVVAFAAGGVVDWLADGETGLAVPNRDAHAFANALERLLRDRDEAQRFGVAARHRLDDQYSRDAHFERLEAVFASALA